MSGTEATDPNGSALGHLADIVRSLAELAQAAAELTKKPLEPGPPPHPDESGY